MEAVDTLQGGRDACAAHEWAAAADALSAADAREPLGPPDLELLATALFMIGRAGDHIAALERAHHGYAEAGEPRRAASCAFWIGMRLFMGGEMGRGGGWLARAQRSLEEDGSDCVGRGYMLMPQIFRLQAEGDVDGAVATAAAGA